jgi:muconate cycloisomerase
MLLRAIDLYHVAVPLRKAIRHASFSRAESENLIVRVTLEDGTTGYGEGVPRPYVTGETIESAFSALSRCDAARLVGDPRGMDDVVRALERLVLPETAADPRGMNGNAARCALELAVFDAYGRHFGESLSRSIRRSGIAPNILAPSPTPVRYGGAITADTDSQEWLAAWKMRLYGFAQVKVKIGVDGQNDPQRLARLRGIFGKGVDIRLDANEAWHAYEVVDRANPLKPFRPTALEQPVPHAEVEALAELRETIGIPVMLDESLCGYPDAVHSYAHQTADLWNVRLSKCGGILPSLRIAGLATGGGLGIQLGCHPGETGLLSAAGRHFAGAVRDLRYVEGSYDRHVLAENVVKEDITFGYGGWAKPLSGPGLGVTVDTQKLARLTRRRAFVRYD